MTRVITRSPALACCGLLLCAGPGLAAPQLEEIIVTAEKREESLQDVPISIAAFTQEALENLGVNDVKDLAATVPNVLINEFTGSSTTVRMFIRGVGQNDVQVTQDPSVALYMDGIYIGSSVGTAFETADVQRIEVLRGPQGTLYGRNATGGAVNIITHQADPEQLTFRQALTGGNLDLFRSRSILNVPLTDTAAVKFAFSTSDRDGWVENEGNGKDFGIERRENFTGDFHWGASETVVLDYKYEHATIEDTARLSQTLGFDNTAPIAGLIVFENPEVDSNGVPVEATGDRLDEATSFDLQEHGDVEIDAHTLIAEWEASDSLTVKSLSGYRDLNAFTQNAQSPTTSLLGQYSITNGLPDTDYEQWSQEFQFLGFGDSLNWVAGLYYYEDKSQEVNLGQATGSEGIPPGELVDFTATENTSLAAYGQATWTPAALDGRWHFTLGARYSDDNRQADRDNSRVSFGLGGAPTSVPPFSANYDKDFDKFNPAFTVQYDLDDFANVYAKVVTAYKSGGTSQRSTSAQNFEAGFREEDLLSYEIGYKGDLAGGRVRLNAAAFYMEYDNYQQSVATGANPGERDFVNIDDADIAGLELDLTVALTEQLTGTFSYGYLDTGFGPESITYLALDTTSPDGVRQITEGLTDDLALAPEHSATLTLDYAHPASYGLWGANLNAQYQDESLGGVQLPSGVLDDRVLVGATLSLSQIQLGAGNHGHLRVQLWGKNLFDEEYYVGAIRQPAFDDLGFTAGLATFGDPRTYGVTVEYQYD